MLDKIKEILAKILPGADASILTENTRLFEDLQFDSLSMMMLLTELEESFNFRFDQFVGFETIGDVTGYLECRV